MPDPTPDAPAPGKLSAEDRAAAKAEAANLEVIEKQHADRREALDAAEAENYARALGEPVKDAD
jgi:hypothetical protein